MVGFILAFVTWDILPWAVGAVLMNTVICGAVIVWACYKRDTHLSIEISIGVGVVVIIIMTFMSYAFSGGCYAREPDAFSFKFSTTDTCESRKLCHVYLTAGKTVSKNMIIHFHSSQKYSNVLVCFDEVSRSDISLYRYKTEPDVYFHSKISRHAERYIYYAYLYNLKPDTQYYFTITSDNEIIDDSGERMFKTMVDDGSNFTFVSGGDLGLFENYEILMDLSSQNEPAFLALGGDLSYANGFSACYGRWDAWLDVLEQSLVTPSGNMIPLITSIGNHEAGGFGMTTEDEPFYSAYFIHEPLLGRSPFDLNRYNLHLLGSNSIMFALDSGVVSDIGGNQAEWLVKQFELYPERHNSFAIYHAGLYPSFRPYSGAIHTTLRENWQPIFDLYKLKVGLENHDHAYKRSKPMFEDNVVELGEGTIYMGDGAMGCHPRLPVLDDSHGRYLDVVSDKNFYLEIVVSSSSISIESISSDNEVFDSIVVPTQ